MVLKTLPLVGKCSLAGAPNVSVWKDMFGNGPLGPDLMANMRLRRSRQGPSVLRLLVVMDRLHTFFLSPVTEAIRFKRHRFTGSRLRSLGEDGSSSAA